MPGRRHVFIVDGQSHLSHRFAPSLGDAGFLPRAFADARGFLEWRDGLGAGCVLLGLGRSDVSGLAVIEALANRDSLMRAVVIASDGDVGTAVRAMKLGAVDYVEKPVAPARIVAILGQVFAALETHDRVVSQRRNARRRLAGLSPREHEVLAGLATGRSNKLLAYDLGLSPRTVEMHRTRMMDRLEAKSLPDALRMAFEAGLFVAGDASERR
jgi:two-component system response regulator FixJ